MRTTAAVLDRMELPRPYDRSQPLRVEELELEAPRAGELLVRIEGAGVCHSDVSVVDGTRPRPVPMVLGHEAAGVVEEVGPGVVDVSPGAHVVLAFVPSCGVCAECAAGRPGLCLPGLVANTEGRMLAGGRRLSRDGEPVHHHTGISGFAQWAVVARGSAIVIDDDVPFDVAPLFGCASLTGVGAVLSTAEVRPGDSVAIFGLGGVGLAALMGAVVAGAHPVVGVDPIPAKRTLAIELGATAAFHPDEAAEGIRDLTGGGARYAFESAGRVEALEAAYAATAPGGTTVAIGLPHPSAELRLPALSIVGQGRTLVGSYMGSAAPQRDVPRFVALWRAGKLPVDRLRSDVLGLEDVNRALEALADGRALRQILRPHGPSNAERG
jgi:alcohol dehydrogenase